jgi:hypothetical protein
VVQERRLRHADLAGDGSEAGAPVAVLGEELRRSVHDLLTSLATTGEGRLRGVPRPLPHLATSEVVVLECEVPVTDASCRIAM